MSGLANYLSDHGECIANADDRMDSEIVAEFVRQRLALLSDDIIDTISCVYGEMFKQKLTTAEYAEKHGVTRSCISARINKARKIILKPGTKLMRHLYKDDYYIDIMSGYRKAQEKHAENARKRKHYKYQEPEYKPQEPIRRPPVVITTPNDPQPKPIYPRKPLSDFERRQQEIQLRYEIERQECLQKLMKEDGFYVQPTINLNDPSLKHFYEALAELRKNSGRK